MTILDQIVSGKYLEIEERKALYPVAVLEKSKFFGERTESLKDAILSEGSTGIIAEFKRRSPSRGVFNKYARATEVCAGYYAGGSSAVSVLTNRHFGGSIDDLDEVCRIVTCPVLCKDFILDEYQIIEARSYGADAVLLITDIHPAGKLNSLYRFALSLGMEVLIEVHNKKYLSVIPEGADIVGINSRNLESFNVSLDHAREMINLLPGSIVKVAESGIKSAEDYFIMKNTGFNAFLIGEYFMNSADPAQSCKSFIETIKQEPASQRN